MASDLEPGRLFALDSLAALPEGREVHNRVLARTAAGNVTIFGFAAGGGIPQHTAPFNVMVITLSGALTLTIGGEEVHTAPRTVVLLPANVPHSVSAAEPSQMLLVHLREPQA